MKRLLTLLLTLAMLFTGFAFAEPAEEPTEIVWFWREGGDIQLPEDSYICQKVLKDLNIKYVHVTSVGMTPEEKLTMLLASGDVPDIIDSYGDKTTELRADGVIIPLDEYITPERVPHMFESVKEFEAALELMRRDDGQIWAIPATFASLAGPTPWIRYDWLENLGLEVPETFEELKDVLIAFTNDDPDGNGEDDTWGTSYGGIYNGISTNLGGGWGTWYLSEDGVEIGFMTQQVADYVAYMRSLIAEGACDPEILDPNELGNGHGDKIIAGKLGFSFGWCSTTQAEDLRKIDPNADWRPMKTPKGIYDQGYLPMDGILRQEYCISKDAYEAGKMDAILALLDYMCNDGGDVENIDYDAPYWEVSYGERGVNWDVTEDGKFDSNGTYIESIKANNEGKDYLNGRCRRFRTIGMQAAVDSSRTPEDKANNDFINSLPLMGSIPQVPGAPIYAEGVVFPNEYVEVMKTLDSLWGIYYNKALLGQIDVYEGIEQFREDAMKAGFGDVEPIIVEMFEKLGKF